MDEAAIIGAGPVGLCLAILLAQQGVEPAVYEQRSEPRTDSRAFGLHPPAQRILEQAGVGRWVQQLGVPIRRGLGISQGRAIGAMDFSVLGGTYPHVLSLPQPLAEQLLRQRLQQLVPGALKMATAFTTVLDQRADSVRFLAGGAARRARWLIAADGVDSAVRRDTGVPFAGRQHADRYLMGDFPDTTGLEHTAALFLHARGIVESFPLPGNLRRWVIRAAAGTGQADPAGIAEAVGQRTGYLLDAGRCTMHSRFATATRMAPAMAHGRVLLIGDAAHQISPIGGQGLNLGFADALELSRILAGKAPLDGFSARRMDAARKAARRAQLNMFLGRALPGWLLPVRDAAFCALAASSAVHDAVARSFTMQPKCPNSPPTPSGCMKQ